MVTEVSEKMIAKFSSVGWKTRVVE